VVLEHCFVLTHSLQGWSFGRYHLLLKYEDNRFLVEERSGTALQRRRLGYGFMTSSGNLYLPEEAVRLELNKNTELNKERQQADQQLPVREGREKTQYMNARAGQPLKMYHVSTTARHSSIVLFINCLW